MVKNYENICRNAQLYTNNFTHLFSLLIRICKSFQEIERIAVTAPLSTKEMIELGEYMLHVKNKRMIQLNVRQHFKFPNLEHYYSCRNFNWVFVDCNQTSFSRGPPNILEQHSGNSDVIDSIMSPLPCSAHSVFSCWLKLLRMPYLPMHSNIIF